MVNGNQIIEEILTVDKSPTSSTPSTLARSALDTGFNTDTSTTLTNNGKASKSKPRAARKNRPIVDGETEGEKESILSGRIADSLCDQLCFDEIGGDWFSQKNGLWSVISEKKAFKIIMRGLNAEMPKGYAINKLNNVKSFLMIYLLLDKWQSKRHLLPMANGVLNTQTMQLSDYSHLSRFNWQLPYSFEPDAKINVVKQWLWDASERQRLRVGQYHSGIFQNGAGRR